MGLSLSWIAAQGVERATLLGALGLAEAGKPERTHPVPPPAKFAAFEDGGWLFVISSHVEFASRERVSAVSQGGGTLGAYLEDLWLIPREPPCRWPEDYGERMRQLEVGAGQAAGRSFPSASLT